MSENTNTPALPDAREVAIALATCARTAGDDPAPVLALLADYLSERPSDEDRKALIFTLVAVQAHAQGAALGLLEAISAAQGEQS